jgi:hypothetical protein
MIAVILETEFSGETRVPLEVSPELRHWLIILQLKCSLSEEDPVKNQWFS